MRNISQNGLRSRLLTATAVAIIELCVAGTLHAQEASSKPSGKAVLEEIVVTARKREENLLDVPVSVSVATGASLERQGIQQLSDAVQMMPAVSVTPTPVGDLLFVRGLGSGENQGFEMSVGTFIDGVYFGRGRSSRHAFLDVDRIEVLKGPQPILFGKNTVAGALNITTRKPTNSVERSIDEYIEPEFGTYRTTAILSGPLSDTLKGRVVLRNYVTDGYMQNNFTGKKEPGRQDMVGRVVLVWEPSSNFDATLKAEYGDAEVKGGRAQITLASAKLQGLIQPVDPKAEYVLNHTKSGPGTAPLFNKEFEKNKTYNGMLTAVWKLGAHELTSVSGYAGYKVDYAFDSDFTPLSFIAQRWDQKWYSWSQELRIASDTKQRLEYQAGVYWSFENLKSFKVASFDFGQVKLPFGTANRVQNYNQDTKNWSAFAEATFNATDHLALVAGYRHTDDKKSLDKEFYFADLGSLVPKANPVLQNVLGLGIPHKLVGIDRNTSNDSIALTVRYKPNKIMYYASYTQGFKAGGFDEGDTKGRLSTIIFQDEKVASYEAGLKSEGLGGRLRTQTSIFYSKYDNLQVSIFDGVSALIVGNAAAAISKGVEFQSEYAASDRLTFGASATFLDSKYDAYKAGPCAFGKGVTCSLTGKSLPYAPKFSGSLNARWEDQLANGWNYSIDGVVFNSAKFFTAGDLDPFVAQGAFTKLDASITLTSPSNDLTLSLIGKNLTDETTSHFGDDIPLSNILGNNYEQYVDPPRTIAVQARYRF